MTGDSFSFGRYNSVDDWGLMVIATTTCFLQSELVRSPFLAALALVTSARKLGRAHLAHDLYADAPSHKG